MLDTAILQEFYTLLFLNIKSLKPTLHLNVIDCTCAVWQSPTITGGYEIFEVAKPIFWLLQS